MWSSVTNVETFILFQLLENHAGYVIQILFMKDIFFPSSHLLLIMMTLFMTRPSWSIDEEPCTHRGVYSGAPPQHNISIFFHMQSKKIVDLLQLWKGGAEGPAAEDHTPFLQQRRLLLFNMWQALEHLALRGNGRWHWDWFDSCSTQSTFQSLNTTSLCRPLCPYHLPFN